MRLSSAYRVLKVAKKYDIVYDANIHVVSFWLGILNKMHLFPAKLVTMFHFPPYAIYMKLCRSDISMFFSEELCKKARKYIHDNRLMFANKWYPDTRWYDDNYSPCVERQQYDFFDNGKTYRCHEIFVEAMKEIPDAHALLVIDKNNIPNNYCHDMANFHIYEINRYIEMIECGELLLKSKSMVIPVKKGVRSTICGSTSFMDAIALGMPIVWHKGNPYSDDIEKYQLGELFERENIEDLKKALRKVLENYDFYHNNMLAFRKTHNIYSFTERLFEGFKAILDMDAT